MLGHFVADRVVNGLLVVRRSVVGHLRHSVVGHLRRSVVGHLGRSVVGHLWCSVVVDGSVVAVGYVVGIVVCVLHWVSVSIVDPLCQDGKEVQFKKEFNSQNNPSHKVNNP